MQPEDLPFDLGIRNGLWVYFFRLRRFLFFVIMGLVICGTLGAFAVVLTHLQHTPKGWNSLASVLAPTVAGLCLGLVVTQFYIHRRFRGEFRSPALMYGLVLLLLVVMAVTYLTHDLMWLMMAAPILVTPLVQWILPPPHPGRRREGPTNISKTNPW
jgi:hypothetical protein